MPPTRFQSILALEENSSQVFMDSTEVLLRISGNILKEPNNPKFRSISLGSKLVTNKLLPASGAMECLFEMGFEEGVDKLILPEKTPLEPLKHIHDELLKRRSQHTSVSKPTSSTSVSKPTSSTSVSKPASSTSVKTMKKSVKNNKTTLIKKELMALISQTKHSFLRKILFWCFNVLQYENYELQLKAMTLVPITTLNLNVMKSIRKYQLELKKRKISNEIIDYQELLLRELCNWFNTEFFTWVNSPECTKCNFKETTHVGMSNEKFPGADRVEEYKCPKCNSSVLFPRYNDPDKLLETRKGRCGEWANCFCLFAIAMGWDARLVFDVTDHVWIEVYSVLKSKWIHCDPCENAVDTPLMYECGWKKKLSYVIAYSKDEIQDVTWRYSCQHAAVLKNRTKCSEEELIDFIIKVRNILLSKATTTRRNYILKRTVLELVDLMKQHSATEAEEKGRISGSLAWRLLRGETTNDADFKPYTWKVEPEDEIKKKFVLSYITSKDTYIKNSKTVFKSWRDGLFTMKSIFKKDERDWKMTYLARQGITFHDLENSERGILSWKFETGDKFAIGTINLKLIRKTFETGMILCKLCSNESCVLVPEDKESFLTDAFIGSKSVELIVELFGGSGSNSWQHAQVLRQAMSSNEATFTIVLNLVQI